VQRSFSAPWAWFYRSNRRTGRVQGKFLIQHRSWDKLRMAIGSFPIVSPLNTIQEIVKNEENVLFARNLYPQEIADAIVITMTDDELVESSIKRNYETEKKLRIKKQFHKK